MAAKMYSTVPFDISLLDEVELWPSVCVCVCLCVCVFHTRRPERIHWRDSCSSGAILKAIEHKHNE